MHLRPPGAVFAIGSRQSEAARVEAIMARIRGTDLGDVFSGTAGDDQFWGYKGGLPPCVMGGWHIAVFGYSG